MTRQAVKKTEKKLPASAPDWGEDAGGGFEDTTAADLSVPFLNVLQSNSPQVEDKDPTGAESGMIFNTVTRELHDGDKGLIFLPCHKEGPLWVEWVPRHKGGGYVTSHAPDSAEVEEARGNPPILNERGEPTRKLRYGDNELIETYYMYGLMLDEEGLESQGFAVISFTSTKIKPYRDWVTAMYTLKGRPPLFANRGRIKTVRQKNDDGSYYNFRVEPLNATWVASLLDPTKNAELLTEARDFRQMVVSGMARAAFETERSTGDGSQSPSSSGETPPF